MKRCTHPLAALILGLLVLACSKDDSAPRPDEHRPRRMVLTWTKVGTMPLRVRLERTASWSSNVVVATMLDTVTATSGTWAITAAPSSFGGQAIFSYVAPPSPGNRCHVVVTQDGQVPEGLRDVWVGYGVPDGGGGVHTVSADVVSLSPNGFQ